MESGNNIQNLASTSEEPKIKKRSAWASLFLTIMCPGLGHFYCGEIKKGFYLYLISTLAIFMFAVLLKFTPSITIFCLFLSFSLVFVIYILIDVILLARRKSNYELKDFNKGAFYIFILLINAYYFRPVEEFFFPLTFTTPTGSMQNTILPGDLFLENDLAYGIRNPFTGKYAYFYSKPKRGDVIDFKNRNVSKDEKTGKVIQYLKRILALPGDTLMIRYGLVYINGEFLDLPVTVNLESHFRPDASYHDPEIFPKGSGWNQDHYGPIVIPRADQIVELDSGNIYLWRKLIENEGNKVEVTWSKIMINDLEQYKYRIKNNYYFVIGDYWHNSFDSRFWGFVAEDDVISKITMIVWSSNIDTALEKTENQKGSIRWDRIGTIIK